MQPTTPELEILKLLWHHQPQTARQIHEHIANRLNWSYSSTRKTLERMGDKNFISTELKGNKKIYCAQLDKVTTLAAFARDFAQRIFELDGPLPVAMFSDSKLIDDSEIADLEKLLGQLDDDNQRDKQ